MSESYDEQPAPEPEPSEPEPSEPEAQAPDFSQLSGSPEFQQAVQQEAGRWLEAELARAAEQANQPADAEIDFLAEPDEVRQNMEALIQRKIDAAIAPLVPAVQQMEQAGWQQKIDQSLGQLATVKEIDQLLPEDTPDDQSAEVMVSRMASAFMPEFQQLYSGDPERALEASLRAAADYVLPFAKAAHGSGYSARSGELQRLSGAPAPAPSTGGPAEILDEPMNELEAAERYSSRHGLR